MLGKRFPVTASSIGAKRLSPFSTMTPKLRTDNQQRAAAVVDVCRFSCLISYRAPPDLWRCQLSDILLSAFCPIIVLFLQALLHLGGFGKLWSSMGAASSINTIASRDK